MISAFNTSNNHLQRNKHTDQRIWRENQTKQKTAILLQMVFCCCSLKRRSFSWFGFRSRKMSFRTHLKSGGSKRVWRNLTQAMGVSVTLGSINQCAFDSSDTKICLETHESWNNARFKIDSKARLYLEEGTRKVPVFHNFAFSSCSSFAICTYYCCVLRMPVRTVWKNVHK